MNKWLIAAGLLAGLLAPLLSSVAHASAACKPGTKLSEEGFVPIDGIEQWVTIHGADCANPVVLIVHGGPGNPSTPFAENVYGPWEKDFTLVQWDQRGSGKTFAQNPDTANRALTMALLARDGVDVASYATRRLGKRQVILLGGSWGSALAVNMLKLKPELFSAYQGSSQLVEYRSNQSATYERILELTRAAGDSKAVASLEALGAPPWENPRAFGIVRRITRRYEAKATQPAPDSWWQYPLQYETTAYQAAYTAGEDYSYMQFVGMRGDGMLSRIDLPALGTSFLMPVFIIQGKEDLLTMPAVTKAYFDRIQAPTKKYIVLDKVGHDPNPLMIDAQFKVLKTQIVPLIHD
ncbi:alpha/beta hydrolase [Rhodanobacter sp. DHG33]|uniref:alpha/beta fold hydrolase n=1 Tax=Rhodanobacter sp. DHG33 TaxID=2775921 RepID=UPI0017801E14|nr:alpha/beta hydrolase [Rhodanobacter sp. DHG33]MBD8898377.1 alpha/beta hydrolase [Rhodanobacter sp. DHG33]